jgi:ammonium transporter, Amt family
MVWGGGFLGDAGVLDFAGGTVVHINAGVAGLVACLVLGKRKGYPHEPMAPHNLVLTLIGASLLWVGWFGFNAGSALAAERRRRHGHGGEHQIAAAAGGAGLDVRRVDHAQEAERARHHSGAIAGLVAITPASGFVAPDGRADHRRSSPASAATGR